MNTEQRVIVVDVNMKFGTMVVFLVKLAIASIPAAIILIALGTAASIVLAGLFGGMTTHL